MEVAEHIAVIRQEGQRFAEAARGVGPETIIEMCPGWTMRDLVRHLSEIHLWAAAHVARRTTKMWVDDLAELSESWPELAVFWPDDDDLVDYYLATNSNLVRQLQSAPADVEAMTFLPAPSPLAMWARRQAHETSIHRFDAQNAGGSISGFEPGFAVDGIDELLMAFAPRANKFPIEDTRAMVVHASDTGDRWRVTLGPEGINTDRRDGPADVTLTGRAADMYLAVWNRDANLTIDVVGDLGLLDAWRSNHRVRWG